MEASDEYEPFYFLYFSDKWFHSPYCQSVRPIEVAAAVEDPILDISDHNANESFEIANESVDIASYHASYLQKSDQNPNARISIESIPDSSMRFCFCCHLFCG